MSTLFLAAMLALVPPEKGEILENLTEPELAALEALSDAEKHFVTAFLSQALPPRGPSLSGSKQGDFFLFRTSDRLNVQTVVDKDNVLVTEGVLVPDTQLAGAFRTVDETVWLEGANTAPLRDGKPLPDVVLMCFCLGSKQYPTTDGSSNTVCHIVTVTPENLAKLAEQFVDAHGYRIWGKGTAGQILGKYVRASSRRVTLLNVHGKRIELLTSKLSVEDQDWVNAQ
jgi:hypothetical protein